MRELTKGQVNPTIWFLECVLNRSGIFSFCLMSFEMTTFAKSVILLSFLIVVLGWLADGGSVKMDAAQKVEQLSGITV